MKLERRKCAQSLNRLDWAAQKEGLQASACYTARYQLAILEYLKISPCVSMYLYDLNTEICETECQQEYVNGHSY